MKHLYLINLKMLASIKTSPSILKNKYNTSKMSQALIFSTLGTSKWKTIQLVSSTLTIVLTGSKKMHSMLSKEAMKR